MTLSTFFIDNLLDKGNFYRFNFEFFFLKLANELGRRNGR